MTACVPSKSVGSRATVAGTVTPGSGPTTMLKYQSARSFVTSRIRSWASCRCDCVSPAANGEGPTGPAGGGAAATGAGGPGEAGRRTNQNATSAATTMSASRRRRLRMTAPGTWQSPFYLHDNANGGYSSTIRYT
jgi:hypothetical protein